jgi:hypothetical protein
MVASAMQQKAAAASAGSPASSALDTSQLLAAATGSSQVAAAGYVPSEYGVTFRAHQHLVMHLPQGEPQTENFSVSSASAASSEDAKPQAGGAAVAEDPAAEERRLLASYGYRGVGGAGTRQRSASERGGSLGGRRATLRL